MDNLEDWRNRIDLLDDILLETVAKRMAISREIGRYKRERGIAILQPERYRDMMVKRRTRAADLGVSRHFVDRLFDLIHEESRREQSDGLTK